MNEEQLNKIKEAKININQLSKQQDVVYNILIKSFNLDASVTSKIDDYLFDAVFNSFDEEYFNFCIKKIDEILEETITK